MIKNKKKKKNTILLIHISIIKLEDKQKLVYNFTRGDGHVPKLIV